MDYPTVTHANCGRRQSRHGAASLRYCLAWGQGARQFAMPAHMQTTTTTKSVPPMPQKVTCRPRRPRCMKERSALRSMCRETGQSTSSCAAGPCSRREKIGSGRRRESKSGVGHAVGHNAPSAHVQRIGLECSKGLTLRHATWSRCSQPPAPAMGTQKMCSKGNTNERAGKATKESRPFSRAPMGTHTHCELQNTC